MVGETMYPKESHIMAAILKTARFDTEDALKKERWDLFSLLDSMAGDLIVGQLHNKVTEVTKAAIMSTYMGDKGMPFGLDGKLIPAIAAAFLDGDAYLYGTKSSPRTPYGNKLYRKCLWYAFPRNDGELFSATAIIDHLTASQIAFVEHLFLHLMRAAEACPTTARSARRMCSSMSSWCRR
jgi:hypothetical protein